MTDTMSASQTRSGRGAGVATSSLTVLTTAMPGYPATGSGAPTVTVTA